jgi:hypothetical protein
MQMAKLSAAENALAEDLRAVFAKHGKTMGKYLQTTLSTNEHRFTISTFTKVAGEDEYATRYKNDCWMHGLKPEWLGKKFAFNGEMVTLRGVQSGNKAMSVVFENTQGRLKVTRAELVRAAFEKQMETA